MVLAPQTAAMGKIRGPHSRELDISSQSSQQIAFDHAALTVNTDAPNPDHISTTMKKKKKEEEKKIMIFLFYILIIIFFIIILY